MWLLRVKFGQSHSNFKKPVSIRFPEWPKSYPGGYWWQKTRTNRKRLNVWVATAILLSRHISIENLDREWECLNVSLPSVLQIIQCGKTNERTFTCTVEVGLSRGISRFVQKTCCGNSVDTGYMHKGPDKPNKKRQGYINRVNLRIGSRILLFL